MGKASGFSYVARKNGEVEIRHGGRSASVLRGKTAAKFLRDVAERDPQELMARVTGNYKRGNETQ